MVATAAPAAAAAMEDVDFVDYEQEEDDLMDEDGVAGGRTPLPVPRLRAATSDGLRVRGRGFAAAAGRSASVLASGHGFDSLAVDDRMPGPQQSVEGWIVLVSGVKEDAEEEDLYNAFSEFGHVKDLHFNLERRTGYAKGYALIEYQGFEEAQAAIKALNGTELLTRTIYLDWAFSKGPIKQRSVRRRSPHQRSRSPRRRY